MILSKNKKTNQLATMFLSSILIVGCTTTSRKSTDETLITQEMNKMLASYAQKAVSAKETTLEHKSAMLQLTKSSAQINDVTRNRLKVALGMDKPIRLNSFQGPVESPLSLIANLTNYKIEYEGIKPIDPIWVKLGDAERSAMSWLNNIEVQTDSQGLDIDIYQSRGALLSDGSQRTDVPNGLIVITYRSELAK